ncbi:hypothetical protein CIB48_g8235 [Xylaria polymorpha]|nr:hypothetical protein CIB48_g8235 [Xylaria polymorpha]
MLGLRSTQLCNAGSRRRPQRQASTRLDSLDASRTLPTRGSCGGARRTYAAPTAGSLTRRSWSRRENYRKSRCVGTANTSDNDNGVARSLLRGDRRTREDVTGQQVTNQLAAAFVGIAYNIAGGEDAGKLCKGVWTAHLPGLLLWFCSINSLLVLHGRRGGRAISGSTAFFVCGHD